MQSNKLRTVAATFVAVLGLSACSDDDDNNNNDNVVLPIEATYMVTVSNVTSAQFLTPLGVVIHKHGYAAWETGSTASIGLEELAESGSPATFLAEADANANVIAYTNSEGGAFPAGSSKSVSITVEESAGLHVTVASMLANTNDAFTGLTSWHISDLAVGESMATLSHVYDAGTESNTEAATDIPGPAGNMAGTEGFSTDRGDLVNVVTIHGGVVTQSDGLMTSALTEKDRWLGPAAKVLVTRTK